MNAIFSPGKMVATPGALALLEQVQMSPLSLIQRHIRGDFGELSPDDYQLNIEAIAEAQGDRIMSNFPLAAGRIWVITEAMDEVGNPATTLLLPEEY